MAVLQLQRLREWAGLPMFGLQDVSGRTIDRQATFQPTPKPIYIAIKLAFLIITIVAISATIAANSFFFFAYLTHWGAILCIFYYISSLAGVISPDLNSNHGHLHTKAVWGIFTVTINLQVFITINFWLLVFNPDTEMGWFEYYNHGGHLVVLLLDGFGIHRLPIRFKHIFLVYAVQVAYMLWTIIHSLSGIGNPLKENTPGSDDDAIYDTLSWSKRPESSAVLCTLLLFVAVPFCFGVVWALSLLVPKRYLEENVDKSVDIEGGKKESFQDNIEVTAD